MELKCHLYNIPGIPNMRDLGGYETKDGKKVKNGRFIRSSALVGVGEGSFNALKELKLDCVVDLRSKMERKNSPSIIETRGDVHYVHVPMLDNVQSNFATGSYGVGFPASMSEMYIGLLDNSGASFKAAFDIFADKSFSSYLFHCAVGKDRTGVVAMLLLGLAGVPDEIIAEDYSYTQYLLEPEQISRPHDIPVYIFESAPSEMMATIMHINEKYGGVSEYLLHIGVKSGGIKAVLKKLLG